MQLQYLEYLKMDQTTIQSTIKTTLISQKKPILKIIDEQDAKLDLDKNNDSDNSKKTNKGTGAGGANTNKYGKSFEEKTNNEPRLLADGFEKVIVNKHSKYGYYLVKEMEDKKIYFVSQSGLKTFMEHKYQLVLFRCPDEAYIVEYNDGTYKILVLEKKEQSVDGSVDTKLLAGVGFIEEYQEALEGKFIVNYGFCVSSFLQNKICSEDKKYVIFNKIMKKHNIPILFGDNENYFETLDTWLSSSL